MNAPYQRKFGILTWSEEDRPREKLLIKGNGALSNAELLAILLGTGTRTKTAVDLAKEILELTNNDLDELGRLSIANISKVSGIGKAKAITITAALELGRRRKNAEKKKKFQVCSSNDAYEYLYQYMADLTDEHFYILLMNRRNQIIAHKQISIGGVTGTIVDAKKVFKEALETLACSIILCHNHPSGNLKPSDADVKLTRKLKDAGDLLDIKVLDHIIFTNDSYYSFADEGLM